MKSKLVNLLCILLASTTIVSAKPSVSHMGLLPGFEGPLVALSLLAVPIVRVIKRNKN